MADPKGTKVPIPVTSTARVVLLIVMVAGVLLGSLPGDSTGLWRTVGDLVAAVATVAYFVTVVVDLVRYIRHRQWPALISEGGYWLLGAPGLLLIVRTSWWTPLRWVAGVGWVFLVIAATGLVAAFVMVLQEERQRS